MINTGTLSLERLVRTELPPLPGSVMRIHGMLSDMNVSQSAIANAISLDPTLATKVLRLANSPLYSLERRVTNLSAAVSAIGNHALAETLLVSGVNDSFGGRLLNSSVGKYIWFHLLSTAMAASELVKLAGLRGADEAFSCGLLHDIGKLILLRADPSFYVRMMERGRAGEDLPQLERAILGFDHAELGATAAELWKLPGPVCTMIRFHHEPQKATEGMAITRIINIADRLVHLKMESQEIDDLLFSETVLGFGFSAAQFETIWEHLIVRLRELTRA
ncbi:HDOD domain-containing protein [soil metagenome]